MATMQNWQGLEPHHYFHITTRLFTVALGHYYSEKDESGTNGELAGAVGSHIK